MTSRSTSCAWSASSPPSEGSEALMRRRGPEIARPPDGASEAGPCRAGYTEGMFHPGGGGMVGRRFVVPTPVQPGAGPSSRAATTCSSRTHRARARPRRFPPLPGRPRAPGRPGTLEDRTEIVYVSPLRAALNDIRRQPRGTPGELRALRARWASAPSTSRDRPSAPETPRRRAAPGRETPAPRARHYPPSLLSIILPHSPESGRRGLSGVPRDRG